ncbi:MAG: alpha/beta hydrolase, partial [Cyanobacteria bacterium P01_G01_bin.19]
MNTKSVEIFQFWWLIPSILSILGLFLSLWIIIPAPNWLLLPFGVCAPEVSPWLIVLNAIALSLAIPTNKGWWSNLIIICSLVSLLISFLPLIQFSDTNRAFEAEMEQTLGSDYLDKIPAVTRDKMRSQPLSILDVFRGIPTSESDIRVERGIVFASPDGVDLKLNTYRPLAKSGNNPTLIVIYGGAWRSGSPDDYEQFNLYMAARGYTVIAIDYRHMPKYKFPTQIEDVDTALEYIQTHADDLEVDLAKMAVIGRSAGGQLAKIAAYKSGEVSFKAVVSHYSPVNLAKGYYDLPNPDPIDVQAILNDFLGGSPEEEPELYKQASPINYTRSDLPPSLLIYGGRDHIIQAK